MQTGASFGRLGTGSDGWCRNDSRLDTHQARILVQQMGIAQRTRRAQSRKPRQRLLKLGSRLQRLHITVHEHVPGDIPCVWCKGDINPRVVTFSDGRAFHRSCFKQHTAATHYSGLYHTLVERMTKLRCDYCCGWIEPGDSFRTISQFDGYEAHYHTKSYGDGTPTCLDFQYSLISMAHK